MAWSRTGLKGTTTPDPSDLLKQGHSHIEDTGQIDSLVNHKNKPGDFGWNDLEDGYFNGENILENGNFINAAITDSAVGNLVGWTNGGTHNSDNHFTISGGACYVIRGSGSGTFYIYQNVLTALGTYIYSINVTTIGQGLSLYTANADLSELTLLKSLSAGTNAGTLTTNSSAVMFIIYPSASTGTTIIDDVVFTPDNKHIPDATNDDTDETGDFGFFASDTISYWFRDDGSTTT